MKKIRIYRFYYTLVWTILFSLIYLFFENGPYLDFAIHDTFYVIPFSFIIFWVIIFQTLVNTTFINYTDIRQKVSVMNIIGLLLNVIITVFSFVMLFVSLGEVMGAVFAVAYRLHFLSFELLFLSTLVISFTGIFQQLRWIRKRWR